MKKNNSDSAVGCNLQLVLFIYLFLLPPFLDATIS